MATIFITAGRRFMVAGVDSQTSMQLSETITFAQE
jgi:hypothetical protein